MGTFTHNTQIQHFLGCMALRWSTLYGLKGKKGLKNPGRKGGLLRLKRKRHSFMQERGGNMIHCSSTSENELTLVSSFDEQFAARAISSLLVKFQGPTLKLFRRTLRRAGGLPGSSTCLGCSLELLAISLLIGAGLVLLAVLFGPIGKKS